jgi:hypothetical protein
MHARYPVINDSSIRYSFALLSLYRHLRATWTYLSLEATDSENARRWRTFFGRNLYVYPDNYSVLLC